MLSWKSVPLLIKPLCITTISTYLPRFIMQIPTTQKALVYDKPGSISAKLVDIPVPTPKDGEVLIRL